MSAWFRFGAQHHIQISASPQVAGCGSRPRDPQPTFDSEDPPEFPCRACLLTWLDSQVVAEEVEDAVGRGYESG